MAEPGLQHPSSSLCLCRPATLQQAPPPHDLPTVGRVSADGPVPDSWQPTAPIGLLLAQAPPSPHMQDPGPAQAERGDQASVGGRAKFPDSLRDQEEPAPRYLDLGRRREGSQLRVSLLPFLSRTCWCGSLTCQGTVPRCPPGPRRW